MTNKDIQNLMFADAQVDSLYWGSTLVWQRANDEPLTGLLRGKFTDDSTEADWWYYRNGSTYSSDKVSIADKVNKETKEFEVSLGNITKLSYLFYNNKAIEYIYELPYNENITSVWNCFDSTDSLQSVNLNGWDNLSEKTSLGCFFAGSGIREIDLSKLDTSKTNNLSFLFNNCKNLEHLNVSNFNTENVEDLSSMFTQSPNLKTIKGLENFKLDKATNFSKMFQGCESIESLDLSNWDVYKENLWRGDICLFRNCTKLQTLKISNWDFSNVYPEVLDKRFTPYIFENCVSLENIIGPIYNLKTSTHLDVCPLTNNSAMTFINGLSTVGETQNITFNSNTYDTLSEEQLATATSKGWTVVRSQIS